MLYIYLDTHTLYVVDGVYNWQSDKIIDSAFKSGSWS